MSTIEKNHPTEAQVRLLKKLSKELEGGARDAFQEFLMQLEGVIAAQKLERSCETTEAVTQLVNYDSSFEGRDGEMKLTFHNSKVTDANLKAAGVLKSFETGTAQRTFKVYRPKLRVSSEKVIELMKRDGYRPATALELLEYYVAQLLAQKFEQWCLLVALGTAWQGDVVYLSLGPAYRDLLLLAFARDWGPYCEFLAVRESE